MSTSISCDVTQPPAANYPPNRECPNYDAMRAAGWTRGVNLNGGTYQQPAREDAERRTYGLNTAPDREMD